MNFFNGRSNLKKKNRVRKKETKSTIKNELQSDKSYLKCGAFSNYLVKKEFKAKGSFPFSFFKNTFTSLRQIYIFSRKENTIKKTYF